MTQAHLDLQSQLDSQNISNASDPSTTPLCNTSLILFLSPLELTSIGSTNNWTEQMEINNTLSASLDTNDVSSQIQKPSDQSISTPPPSKTE